MEIVNDCTVTEMMHPTASIAGDLAIAKRFLQGLVVGLGSLSLGTLGLPKVY